MALYMIDVNNLKLINDSYGHAYGDEMIIEVSKMLLETIFAGAHVGRVSGDEYVALVPNCGEASAFELEKAIKRKLIRIKGVHFNVSVGFFIINDDSISCDYTFSQAESNMYNHKSKNKSAVNARILRELLSQLYMKYPNYQLRRDGLRRIVKEMANHIKLSREEVETLMLSCELQDIGLTVVQPQKSIEHVQKSFTILNALNKPHNVSNTCFYHHECFDGSGYPEGLKGGNIPFSARMLKLTNTIYDHQMRSKSGLLTLEALKKDAGKIVDPALVKQLENMYFSTFLDTLEMEEL